MLHDDEFDPYAAYEQMDRLHAAGLCDPEDCGICAQEVEEARQLEAENKYFEDNPEELVAATTYLLGETNE
jgi:hypothetical protein